MFPQFKWTLKSFRRFPSSSSSIDGHHTFIPRIKIPFIGLENCSPLFCFSSYRWILYGFDRFSEKFSSAVYFLQNRITLYQLSTCIPCFVKFQCLSHPLRFSLLCVVTPVRVCSYFSFLFSGRKRDRFCKLQRMFCNCTFRVVRMLRCIYMDFIL